MKKQSAFTLDDIMGEFQERDAMREETGRDFLRFYDALLESVPYIKASFDELSVEDMASSTPQIQGMVSNFGEENAMLLLHLQGRLKRLHYFGIIDKNQTVTEAYSYLSNNSIQPLYAFDDPVTAAREAYFSIIDSFPIGSEQHYAFRELTHDQFVDRYHDKILIPVELLGIEPCKLETATEKGTVQFKKLHQGLLVLESEGLWMSEYKLKDLIPGNDEIRPESFGFKKVDKNGNSKQ